MAANLGEYSPTLNAPPLYALTVNLIFVKILQPVLVIRHIYGEESCEQRAVLEILQNSTTMRIASSFSVLLRYSESEALSIMCISVEQNGFGSLP